MDDRNFEEVADEIINKYGEDIENALREESLLTTNYISQTLEIARDCGDPKVALSALALIITEFVDAYDMNITPLLMEISVLVEKTRKRKRGMRGDTEWH